MGDRVEVEVYLPTLRENGRETDFAWQTVYRGHSFLFGLRQLRKTRRRTHRPVRITWRS